VTAEFDRHASSYEAEIESAIAFAGQPHARYLEAKTTRLLEVARRRLGAAPGQALDVGCGTGVSDLELVGAVGSLHGVDVSEEMVERARVAVPQGDFQVYDGSRLPYEDDRFDLVFAICVFHHVPAADRPALLAEMRRVTRRGGLVVVFEHNPWNPLTRRVVRSIDFDADAELLSLPSLVSTFRAADLDVTDREYLLFTPWQALDRLERRIGRVPLGAQYFVAGQRT
jgi:ubiquinone/menaquinone biosynthesis C-methylase UbiE